MLRFMRTSKYGTKVLKLLYIHGHWVQELYIKGILIERIVHLREDDAFDSFNNRYIGELF